jgi:hypothetical protein
MPPERVHVELLVVERGLFRLMDAAATEASSSGGWPLPQGEAVAVARGRVLLTSAAPDHVAAVRLEAWS